MVLHRHRHTESLSCATWAGDRVHGMAPSQDPEHGPRTSRSHLLDRPVFTRLGAHRLQAFM